MAIFYEHIKGINSDNVYSWIKWGNATDSHPEIFYNGTAESNSLGYILTTKGGQEIAGNNIFSGNNSFSGSNAFTNNNVFSGWVYLGNSNHGFHYEYSPNYIQGEGNFYFADNLTINGVTTINDNVTIGGTGKNLTVSGFVQALYFNATSDYRAKTAIRPAEFSALDFITRYQVFNFSYKESGDAAIGLIAQDLQDEHIDDFYFVNNREATGENGDYMTIKESKLVYVLWKAIQEQQQQINELKALVESLSK